MSIIGGPAHVFAAAIVAGHGVAQFRAVARPHDDVPPEFRVLVNPALGPPHGQQPGQNVNENATDPRGHPMRLRRSKVNVQHHHRHANTFILKELKKEKERRRMIELFFDSVGVWEFPIFSPDGNENHSEN